MSASEHFRAGRIDEAIAEAQAAVRSRPNDEAARYLLAELLCFNGQLDKADKQLDALRDLDPKSMMTVSMFRQLIRSEQAREQFYQDGRLPEFIEKPSADLELHLKAAVLIREGNKAEAERLLAEAESQRVAVRGACDGEAFADFRDLDDLTSSFFEVYTATGKYYWLPFDKIEEIEFRAPDRPRYLLWRSARLSLREGADLEVHLPALYPGSSRQDDVQCRLGRMTDWQGGDPAAPGPMRGVGQRTFLVGEETRGIMQINSIRFEVG
jgi:type VI secretion system protein ImpE